MTITHQTVLDQDGNPTAALIPWNEFQILKAEFSEATSDSLSPEWKEELDHRLQGIKDGSSKGIAHDDVMDNVRARIKQVRLDAKQSA